MVHTSAFVYECVFTCLCAIFDLNLCLSPCITVWIRVCVYELHMLRRCSTLAGNRMLPAIRCHAESFTQNHTEPTALVAYPSLQPYRSSVPSLLTFTHTPTHTNTQQLHACIKQQGEQTHSCSTGIVHVTGKCTDIQRAEIMGEITKGEM